MANIIPYPVPHPPVNRLRTAAPLGAAPSVNYGGLPFPVPKAAPFEPWNSDPGVVAARGAQTAGDTNAQNLLTELTNSAQYRYNGAGNPYATTALLKQEHTDAIRAYMNNLAARGILRSGETGYQSKQESKRYGLQLYTAENALNDLLAQYRNQYVTQTNTDASGAAAALADFWRRMNEHPELYPAPKPPDPSRWLIR